MIRVFRTYLNPIHLVFLSLLVVCHSFPLLAGWDEDRRNLVPEDLKIRCIAKIETHQNDPDKLIKWKNRLDLLPKFLIVDDSKVDRMVLKKLLDLKPYIMFEAENGEEAISLCETFGPFIFITMDGQMPQLNGLATVSHIRHKLKLNTPIFVISSQDTEEEKKEFMRAGATYVFSKPFTKDQSSQLYQLLQNR
ncbi:MAG: response regulator [Alphaproteobacteria bacterium]|nr:response regulator [Alphaproteobacteria bacterium]